MSRQHADHPPDIGAVLGRLALVGPYFAVGLGEPPIDARPLAALYDTGPGSPVRDAVRGVAVRLGTGELRVAASTFQLGVAARLWSVVLGCAVLGGRVPDLDPGRTAWRLPVSGPVELWIPNPGEAAGPGQATGPGEAAGPGEAEEGSDGGVDAGGSDPAADTRRLAAAVYENVAVHHLEPLAAAVRAATPVAPRLLWGNAASALAGAARVLYARTRAPGPGPHPAAALVGLILGHGHLRGTGTYDPRTLAFRRTSCCLYYRVPRGGGLCGDCGLRGAPSGRG